MLLGVIAKHSAAQRLGASRRRCASSGSLLLAAWTKDQASFDALWGGASLEERRALVAAENQHGWRALHFACVHGQQDMLHPLLEDLGCDNDVAAHVSAPTKQGWTPLHYAAGFGKVGAIDALLAAGADINVRNEGHDGACLGWTPWHRAVRWWLSPGKPNAIAHLLAIPGLQAHAMGADGRTAATIANPEVHAALEALLRAEAARQGAGGGGCSGVAPMLKELLLVREAWQAEAAAAKAEAAAAAAAAAAGAETKAAANNDGSGSAGAGGGGDGGVAVLEERLAALERELKNVVADPCKHGLSSRADCMAREADLAFEMERIQAQIAAAEARSSQTQ